jgi:2,5-diamino-6-(ribosylamino)-4(3H)-pyrimidinone 5'-phosphate reductase
MKPLPPQPWIAINMAMSADGKISTYRRESFQLGTRHDKQMMNILRARCDAVIIGSGTCRVDGYPLIVRDPALVQKRIARNKPVQPVNVIMSGSLELPLAKKLFRYPGTEKVVFTLRSVPAEKIKRVEKYAAVVLLPGKSVSPRLVVRWLAQKGYRQLLVEGGGATNYSFLKAGLVDELYITLAPAILGGADAPTVADGRGFLKKSRVRLELVSSRKIADEIFLRYRVVK